MTTVIRIGNIAITIADLNDKTGVPIHATVEKAGRMQ